MNDSTLRACILAAVTALEDARDELTRLDAVAGDGDHGVTMTLAARAVRQRLDAVPDAEGAVLLTQVAQAVGSVGGAVGPLAAVGLLRAAAAARGIEQAGRIPTTADLREATEMAEAAIQDLGGARPGAKTMLDALHPAAEALRQAEAADADPRRALADAAEAARRGADATADMVATIGRASRLGERSRGTPDAGATSLALILEAASTVWPPDGMADLRA